MYIGHRGMQIVDFQEQDFSIVICAQKYVRTITTGIPSDLSISGSNHDLEFLDYLLYETILRTSEDVTQASIVWGEVIRKLVGLKWAFLENGSNRTPCLSDGDINITLIDPHSETLGEFLRCYTSFSSLTITSLITFCYRSNSKEHKQAALKYLEPLIDQEFHRYLSSDAQSK